MRVRVRVLNIQWAQTLERAGDINGATNAYKELLQSEPGNEAVIDAQLGLARLAVLRKEPAKVREAVRTVGRFCEQTKRPGISFIIVF